MVATEAEFVDDSQALAIRSSETLMPALSMPQAIERYNQIKEFVTAVMDSGRDYGAIPGAGKDKVLLKPGAEKLCTLFNLKPRLVILEETEDWMGAQHGGEAFFSYHYKIQLYRNEEFMGEADAALNSWEEKYRWRSGNRKCPLCNSEAIIVGKKEYGGGFVCFTKKGGCGAKFTDDDTAIITQQTGRVPNDRIFDQINTMRKMCYKRALIAATLVAVNASDFFTQDLDNDDDNNYPPPGSEPPPAPAQPTATTRKGPLTINKEQAQKLGGTAAGRNIPTEEAAKIVKRFGFDKAADITVDKFNDVLVALCDWKAPEATEEEDDGGSASDNAIITPAPASVRKITEKESLAEKRKEIDSLGEKLLKAGVTAIEITSLIEQKTGVRETKHVDSGFDADAAIVAMESRLEQAQKPAKKKAS